MPVGGRVQYRHLGRDAAHRKALLRNLVTSLFKHEAIQTTWPKAKEAQRLAEKLVTLAKRNTPASRVRAGAIFYQPHLYLPKLFGAIRRRYAERPGGYTRVLRIEPLKEDQAPSAILELVDGPKDMRFALTAQTVARDQALGRDNTDITKKNIKKVTQFREEGMGQLAQMVERITFADSMGVKGRRADNPRKYRLANAGRLDDAYVKDTKDQTIGSRSSQQMSPAYKV